MGNLEKYHDMAELDDILIDCKNGIITRSQLDIACEDYVKRLKSEEQIYKNSSTFQGLLNYVGNRLIKPLINTEHYKDYDFTLLNNIYNSIFIYLCNIYGYVSNIIMFCNMCNIDYDYISNIHTGNTSNMRVNKYIYRVVKIWFRNNESLLVDKTVNHNSIGSMFMLKARYGYREQSELVVKSDIDTPKIDTSQLDSLADNNGIPAQLPNL